MEGDSPFYPIHNPVTFVQKRRSYSVYVSLRDQGSPWILILAVQNQCLLRPALEDRLNNLCKHGVDCMLKKLPLFRLAAADRARRHSFRLAFYNKKAAYICKRYAPLLSVRSLFNVLFYLCPLFRAGHFSLFPRCSLVCFSRFALASIVLFCTF